MGLLGLLRRAGVPLFFTLLVREASGMSADGTSTISRFLLMDNATTDCPSTCFGANCDGWAITCSELESVYGCDCGGCVCPPTLIINSESSSIGNETLEFPSCRGDEKFDERSTELFFHQGCLLRSESHAEGVCPVDAINDFMSNFMDALRFESLCADIASVLLLTCIGCAGGIPNPHNGIAGIVLFAAWQFMLQLQYLVMFGSALMVVCAYFSMRSQYWGCLVEMSNGDKLIDAVAGLTFPLQPVFLAKQAVMMVYFLLMYQGAKVWTAMMSGKSQMLNYTIQAAIAECNYTGSSAGKLHALLISYCFHALQRSVQYRLAVFVELDGRPRLLDSADARHYRLRFRDRGSPFVFIVSGPRSQVESPPLDRAASDGEPPKYGRLDERHQGI